MLTALPEHSRISVEEYFQLQKDHPDTKYEYADGWVYALAGGNLDHARIGLHIASVLDTTLGNDCEVFNSDAIVQLSESRYFMPDVMVSCDQRDQGKTDQIRFPRVIFEVLSPSTINYDRGKKFLYYEKFASLQEYVIVYTDYQAVEVFTRENPKVWKRRVFRPDEVIEIESISVRLSFSTIYRKTSVPVEEI